MINDQSPNKLLPVKIYCPGISRLMINEYKMSFDHRASGNVAWRNSTVWSVSAPRAGLEQQHRVLLAPYFSHSAWRRSGAPSSLHCWPRQRYCYRSALCPLMFSSSNNHDKHMLVCMPLGFYKVLSQLTVGWGMLQKNSSKVLHFPNAKHPTSFSSHSITLFILFFSKFWTYEEIWRLLCDSGGRHKSWTNCCYSNTHHRAQIYPCLCKGNWLNI